jgi:hypothetical protein
MIVLPIKPSINAYLKHEVGLLDGAAACCTAVNCWKFYFVEQGSNTAKISYGSGCICSLLRRCELLGSA